MSNEHKPGATARNGTGRGPGSDGHGHRSPPTPLGNTPVEKPESAAEPLAFEEALGRLDELVTVLEEGRTPLEEALALYEEGVRMAEYCQRMLDQAELRLQRLTVKEDGQANSFALESFILDEDV
jgi:exodeoxyribonuclease VII small subunit